MGDCNSYRRPKRQSAHQRRIEEFMCKGGQKVPESLNLRDSETRKLRARLILEETVEVIEAMGFRVLVAQNPVEKNPVLIPLEAALDPAHIAKELADLSVVPIGTMSAFGMQDEPLLQAVDNSNLSKVQGGPVFRADGKLLKGPDYKEPDMNKALGL